MSIERGQGSQYRRIRKKRKPRKEARPIIVEPTEQVDNNVADVTPYFENAVKSYIEKYGSLTHNPYAGKSEAEKKLLVPAGDKLGKNNIPEIKSDEFTIAIAVVVMLLTSQGILQRGIQYGVSTAQHIFSSKPPIVEPVPYFALLSKRYGDKGDYPPNTNVVFSRSHSVVQTPTETHPPPTETKTPTPFPQKGRIYGRRPSF